MNRASQFIFLLLSFLVIACKAPCDDGDCPSYDLPPAYTAFWGDIFDAIGAGAYIGDNKVILFNLEGDQYVIADQNKEELFGPYDLDDPNSFMGDCPFDRISAIQFFRDDRLYMFDATGTQFIAMTLADRNYFNQNPITKWGNGNHPFDLYGVSACMHIDYYSSLHFDQEGTQVASYDLNTLDMSPANPIQDNANSLKIEAIGASVYLPLDNRYGILFTPAGTEYTILNIDTQEYEGVYRLKN
ncbi:MAG: hypothetical protein AAFN10_27500 [Bacteroidota bacterium]